MKRTMLRWLSLGLGASVFAISQASLAQSQYSSITVFGDSLSDTGNIPRLIGFKYPPAPYYNNEFSNGPIYVTYLDGLFGIATPVKDFAIGGAKTGAGNIGGLPGNPKIGLPNAGIDGELTYYLQNNPTAGSRDLFIMFGGANDYFSVLPSLSATGLSGSALQSYLVGPTGPVTQTVGNLVTDVKRLAAIGVRNFVVPNLPNLGATPAYNADPVTSSEGALLASTHNVALGQAMGQLQRQLHVNITIVDVGAVFQGLIANPARFGIDPNHDTDQCLLNPACVSKHLNYLFWDDVHPTGFVQQELSEVFFDSLSGPTTVGAEMDVDKIVQQDLFDHVSARTAALREGASGFSFGSGGASASLGGDPDKPLSGFLTDSYGWGSRDARQSVVGYDYRHNMTSGGLDYRVNDWAAVGALIGYSETNDTLRDSMGAQSFNSYQAALYATAFSNGWYGTLTGTYAYDEWNKLERNLFIGGETANAQTSGHVLGGKLEGGYVMHVDQWSIGPTAELRLAQYRIGSYTEQGGIGVNQEVDGQSMTSMIGQFGVQASWSTTLGSYLVTPQLRASYDHEFHYTSRAIVTRIASQLSTSVTTDILPDGEDWARLGAGVAVQMTDQFSALLDFDSSIGRTGGEDYSALFRLKAVF